MKINANKKNAAFVEGTAITKKERMKKYDTKNIKVETSSDIKQNVLQQKKHCQNKDIVTICKEIEMN